MSGWKEFFLIQLTHLTLAVCHMVLSIHMRSELALLILVQVFVCGAKECRRFYHPDCVSKLLIPEGAQSNLACSIRLGEETFICPLHTCASCNSAGDDS